MSKEMGTENILRISDLIEKLQAVLREHGDLQVVNSDAEYGIMVLRKDATLTLEHKSEKKFYAYDDLSCFEDKVIYL